MSSSILRLMCITCIASIAAVGIFLSLEKHLTQQYRSYSVVRVADAFVPQDLVVVRGSTVLFINDSPTLSWPASDIHPTHSTYPEFDSLRELSPGEVWSFTFEREGVWGFHDHLVPNITGRIIVTGQDGLATRDECSENVSSHECRSATLSKALETRGLRGAFATLSLLHESQETFALHCHLYTHDIGLRAYHMYKEEVLLIPETKYCNAGFFHGYMEGFFSDSFDPELANNFCSYVGAQLETTFPNAENQCRHGIGHGAMEAVLFEHPYLWGSPLELLQRGFTACKRANASFDQQMRCASGITSTFADWALLHVSFADYIKPETMLTYCAQQEDEASKQGCYWGMAKRYFWIPESRGDHERSLSLLVENFPREDYEKYAGMAIQSVTSRMGREGVRGEPDPLIKTCRSIPKNLQSHCLQGMVESIMYAGIPGIEDVSAFRFCDSEMLEDSEKQLCYSAMVERMRQYERKRLEKVCSEIPKAYSENITNCN